METDFIKKIIEDILLKIPVHAELKEVSGLGSGDIVKFSVHTDDPHFLIGLEGKTLLALNHLIKKIAEKQGALLNRKKISFIVDVNDYQEKKIQELNPSFFCFQAPWLWENIKELTNNNAQKEYYLTDLLGMAIKQKEKVFAISVDPKIALGINTPEELSWAQKLMIH